MGTSQSDLKEHVIQELSEQTGFSPEQIRILHKRFKSLSKNGNTLRRSDLENISDLNYNPIKKQIINAFFDKRNFRKNEVGTVEEINFEEFLNIMSHFRPMEQNLTQEEREMIRREKLRFLFNMHDKNNDGSITLEEYRKLIEELLSKSEIEEATTKDIADAAMLEVTKDSDESNPSITFDDFLQILKSGEIESRMYIRFLYVDTMPMSCAK